MITSDAMQGWHDFFVGEAGASAALAGLLFVAISINLARILEYRHLPSRAVETLLALLSVLIVATFALVPGQSFVVYGAEIGGTGLMVWAIQSAALLRTWKNAHPQSRRIPRVLANQLPPIPFLVAGGMLA